MILWADLNTTGKIEAIQTYCVNGSAASECVRALTANGITGMTRNAVIGHVLRNMRDTWRFGKVGGNQKSSKPKKSHPGPQAIKDAKAARAKRNGSTAKARLPRAAMPKVSVLDLSHKVPFIEVQSGQCRYPLWEGGEPIEQKFYCGAGVQDGSSYCGFHHHKCMAA